MDNARHKAQNVKLAVFDVDGVMTDGGLYFTSDGDEIKQFNVKDGLGIKWLMRSGIQVAIITGRQSALVTRRAKDLGIELLVQGREDKVVALQEMLAELNLTSDEVGYLGDDLPDLAAIRFAGFGATVADGVALVKQHADWISQFGGGKGGVRDFCEFILDAQDKLALLQERYLNG